MNLVLISNFLNTHMLPICNRFYDDENIEDFIFIALKEQSDERSELGFIDINKEYSYVLCAYESEDNYKRALNIIEEFDIAIIADAPYCFVKKRMENEMLTFLCGERFYKKGIWRLFNPKTYFYIYNGILKYKNEKNLYYLTIGTYMPYDLHLLNFPITKCFQWAYFPQINTKSKKFNKDSKIKLLWVGRMLKVKHPEIAIETAYRLKKEGVCFELNMIGDGAEYDKIKKLIKKKELQNVVNLLGTCEPKLVQSYMLNNDIFLFTSDYWEGWGAVLNEAMGNGCIPIASIKAGASNILVNHGVNGFLYKSVKQIVNFINSIQKNENLKKSLSLKAKETIEEVWSPTIAETRFIQVSKALLDNKELPKYTRNSPMSLPILKKAKNFISTDK